MVDQHGPAPASTLELDRRFQELHRDVVEADPSSAGAAFFMADPRAAAARARAARREVATGLALINDILTNSVRAWQGDPRGTAALPPAALAGYITFTWGRMHWGLLPMRSATRHKTAEAIRAVITDRILEFGSTNEPPQAAQSPPAGTRGDGIAVA